MRQPTVEELQLFFAQRTLPATMRLSAHENISDTAKYLDTAFTRSRNSPASLAALDIARLTRLRTVVLALEEERARGAEKEKPKQDNSSNITRMTLFP